MILKYVLKNFRRRKVRTLLMVLSLLVSTGLVVAMSATVETIRRSNVDLLATAIGRYDLRVYRTETSTDPFVEVSQTSQTILDADPQVTAVYPRFFTQVELNAQGRQTTGWLLAIDPAESIGQIEVISGTLALGSQQAAVLESTALVHGLALGDTIDVAYSFPLPREEGKAAPLGSSSRRANGRFTINAIVRQNGVVSSGINEGLIIHIQDAQTFLGLPNRAQMLVGLINPALYEAGNAEEAALGVRNVAVNIQSALGSNYIYAIEKASALDQSAQAFLVLQALINTYGLMALAVVGLLVHTLVMTNVQEQKREMAILRILGSRRSYLFAIVIAEVAVIGFIGVGLGIIFGQFVTQYVVIPLIEWQMSQQGLTATIQPAVSISTILPVVVSAIVVLFVSALKPAQDAANTKVMHAINPSVADNLQLSDLEELREHRPTLRLFGIGLILMLTVVMVIGLSVVSTLGNPAAEAAIILAALLMMVTGVGLVFLIVTRPLEKLILLITSLIAPRLTYFAKRNVARSSGHNTLISLLVLFSGVLPSFLATQSAISSANLETDVRLDMGAPVEMRVFARSDDPEFAALNWLRPSFLTEELAAVAGLDQAVGMTHAYSTRVSDAIHMRTAAANVVGVTGDLNDVLYGDLIIFSEGGVDALTAVTLDPHAVIISEGLASVLAIPLGGTIQLEGEGLDHREEMRVVGIARRIPGFDNMGRSRAQAADTSTILTSLAGFQRLSSNPRTETPSANAPMLDRILATVTPDADVHEVNAYLSEHFWQDYNMWTQLADVRLQQARSSRVQEQAFLLVLTLISFTTAVFGVFAVIYVTVYSRRMEIGMMKAFGTRNWELTGILSIESIAMTLSAALAGILAGSTMGYLFAYTDNLTAQRPMQFAIDGTVLPFVVIMVVLASILGTVFSARRIVKRKAVEILRMS
jgi:putative ABC transport system permease protein